MSTYVRRSIYVIFESALVRPAAQPLVVTVAVAVQEHAVEPELAAELVLVIAAADGFLVTWRG